MSDYGPNLFVWKVLNTIYFYHFSYLFIYFPRYTFLIVAGIGPFLIYCQKLRYTCFFTMQEMHSSTSREQLCTLIMQHVQVHTKPEQNVINNIAAFSVLGTVKTEMTIKKNIFLHLSLQLIFWLENRQWVLIFNIKT